MRKISANFDRFVVVVAQKKNRLSGLFPVLQGLRENQHEQKPEQIITDSVLAEKPLKYKLSSHRKPELSAIQKRH